MLLKMETKVRQPIRGVNLTKAEKAAVANAKAGIDWNTTWRDLQQHLDPIVMFNNRRWHQIHRHLFFAWLEASTQPDQDHPEPWRVDDAKAEAKAKPDRRHPPVGRTPQPATELPDACPAA